MSAPIGSIIIDGTHVPAAEASLPVTDIGFQRGYGCFEVLRAYGGVPFRLDEHLDRLAASAAMLSLPLVSRSDLAAWVRDRAAEGDCAVRIVVTGGSDQYRPGTDSHTVVIAEEVTPMPREYRITPIAAPWHSDGAEYELTGGKTLSYAPNIVSIRSARQAGFDDGLLVGRSGYVLEGPTWTPGWVVGDRFEIPDPALGILAGITVDVVVEVAESIGLNVARVRRTLSELRVADEIVTMSTMREVAPVVLLGERRIPAGPVTARLREGFASLVAAECGSSRVTSAS